MNKLFFKFLLFLVLIWISDFVIGSVIEKMYFSIETGTSGAMINHLTKNKYDVYIMGASAAQHGYIPEIIEKEIRMSVYNAGEDATSIFYKYAILQLILQHAKPKLIIWDVLDLDYYYYQDYVKSNLLKPYHRNPIIYRLLRELDRANMAVKISRIYPYNQKIAAVISESLASESGKSHSSKGYLPSHGEIRLDMIGNFDNYVSDYMLSMVKRERNTTPKDELVREYLRLFIDQCRENDIELIAFTSPRCPANKDLASTPMISGKMVQYLATNGIKVHHIQPDKYPQLYKTDLFKDLGHLNDSGAGIYSKIIATIISENM